MNFSDLKPLVNNPELWPLLRQYLETLVSKNYEQMGNAEDLLTIGRFQGRAAMCRELMKLRDQVNGQS